jgi:hypothetical protein
MNHGQEQIAEQQEGDQPGDQVFHKCPSELFAPAGVEFAGGEKADDNGDEYQVQHVATIPRSTRFG